MKYYIFELALKNIGRNFPQIQDSSPFWDSKITHILYKVLTQEDGLKNVKDNEIHHFYLTKGAKVTDLISVVQIYYKRSLLINDRLFTILNQNPLGEKYSVKTSIIHKDKLYENYNLFSIESTSIKDMINFKESKFSVRHAQGNRFLYDIKIDSYEQYKLISKNELKSYENLFSDKLSLNNSKILNCDFIKVAEFKDTYIISENIKDKLISGKLTGCSFEKEIEIEFNHKIDIYNDL